MKKLLAVWLCCLCSIALALDRQDNSVYRARREALAKKVNRGVIVLFADTEAPDATRDVFRQSDNFYYLSGWTEPAAVMVIAPAVAATEDIAARPYSEILFLPPRNPRAERFTGPKLGPENPEAAKQTGFDKVEPLDKLGPELAALSPQGFTLAYTELPSQGQASPAGGAWDLLRRSVSVRLDDVSPFVDDMRRTKDAGEAELIRKATAASMQAHLAAMKAMKPGMTEREIAGLMYYQSSLGGCERWAYSPIVGSGINGTTLHYGANSKTIQNGDLVVIDVACEYSMYATDITRTLPANGKFTPRQREIYDIVLGAQNAAIAAFQSGKSVIGTGPDGLQKVAYDYINTHGKDLHGQPLGKYFIHGLGHHVGLEVHDVGDRRKPLEPGTVFTIEPGIYLPEESFGVRIEDMFYVDPSGKLIQLTASLPRNADDVERAMASKK
jgi:Xaa-Pro aminopeptidase